MKLCIQTEDGLGGSDERIAWSRDVTSVYISNISIAPSTVQRKTERGQRSAVRSVMIMTWSWASEPMDRCGTFDVVLVDNSTNSPRLQSEVCNDVSNRLHAHQACFSTGRMMGSGLEAMVTHSSRLRCGKLRNIAAAFSTEPIASEMLAINEVMP